MWCPAVNSPTSVTLPTGGGSPVPDADRTVSAVPRAATSLWRSRGTLGEFMSRRANSFGFLRLGLALAVVVSHSKPIGYGTTDPGTRWTGGQTNLGSLAVVGFFTISGFMITGSGLHLGIGRYAWHRALRLLPGLWVCVAVTAFVVAPVLYLHQHGSTAGFWHNPDGPLQYVEGTWNTSLDKGFDISGVMRTAIRRGTNFNGSFDGALWSLSYEILCYVGVGILAVGGVLARARRTIPLLAAGLWMLIVMNLWDAPTWRGAPRDGQATIDVPLLGHMITHYLIYLGFIFLLGAVFRLYQHRIPVNDLLALAALIAVAGSLRYGAFYVIGYPALTYLVIWLGVRLPRPLQAIGRTHDYSYGVYIYGFIVEQAVAMFGGTRHGRLAYLAVSVALTLLAAAGSWHLVERPALRLRHWTPRLLRRRPPPSGSASEPATGNRPTLHGVPTGPARPV